MDAQVSAAGNARSLEVFFGFQFQKKGKRPTASYSIILDQYSIWHLTSRCVSHVWSTFDSPHLELLR